MDTVILSTHSIELLDEAVARAAELLRAGQVVAIPTETVYGLAGNAFDEGAVRRIFEVKDRPAHNPLIVHVNSVELAQRCVQEWPPQAQKLAQAFWPGPLTMVLPRSERLPDIVTAGGATAALRWPRHPFVQKVIAACGFPLAAPSANVSGELSPTTAQHVFDALRGRIPLIVDGGPSNVGIESTVVDLANSPPRILRPGIIHAEAIAAVLGERVLEAGAEAGGQDARPALRSPGMLERHYAPKARLIVMDWPNDAELMARLGTLGVAPETTHILAHSTIPAGSRYARVSVIPYDPEAFARALYAELHRADELGAVSIIVEAVPNGGPWRAVADRLRRASA